MPSKPITNRSRVSGVRETTVTCCDALSNSVAPGTWNQPCCRHPRAALQNVDQTRLSAPITKRSRLFGKAETAATFCVVKSKMSAVPMRNQCCAQPCGTRQKSDQTDLSDPITNRSNVSASRETTDTPCDLGSKKDAGASLNHPDESQPTV